MTQRQEHRPERLVETPLLYRQVMAGLVQRKREVRLANWQVDDLSGVQDGYFAKMASPDAPQGRMAGWQAVDEVCRALYPDGFVVLIHPAGPRRPRGSGALSAPARHGRHRRPRPVTYLHNRSLDPAMDVFTIRLEALRLATEAGGSPADITARAAAYAEYLGGSVPPSRPPLAAPANDAHAVKEVS